MHILIVEDHAVTREGLRQFLIRHDHSASIEEAADCGEALGKIAVTDFSLVLLDLTLPDAQGMRALDRVREAAPGLPVVVFSGSDDHDTVTEALQRGARGFISKSADSDAFHQALKDAVSGRISVSETIIRAVSQGAGGGIHAYRDRMRNAVGTLTPRQREVLDLIVDGLSNKLIARRLEISPETAKIHVSGVLRAFGVPSRPMAVVAAAAAGLLFPLTPR